MNADGGLEPRALDLDAEFPVAREATYLNHAASAPLPTRSAEALRRFVADRQRLFHLYQEGRQDFDPGPLRAKLGRLLGAEPGSIGFVPCTSDGLSGILNGLDWAPGDNVVLPEGDFPSLAYACQRLEARGVRLRRVPGGTGRHGAQALLARTDARTRALVASHVHWLSGDRIDLEVLGRGCRERGVLSLVDAIQGVGAVPVDLGAAPVDVLLAGTYKWLLGIQGLAVLHVAGAALERITPDRAGWQSRAGGIHGRPDAPWAPGAWRFSVGGGNDPAMVALEPSVDLLLQAGPAAVLAHAQAMLDRLLEALRPRILDRRLRLHSDLDPAARSAFLNLGTGDPDHDAALVRDLAQDRIIVAQRGPGLRIAPHLHTRPEQMDRMAERIEAFLRRSH